MSTLLCTHQASRFLLLAIAISSMSVSVGHTQELTPPGRPSIVLIPEGSLSGSTPGSSIEEQTARAIEEPSTNEQTVEEQTNAQPIDSSSAQPLTSQATTTEAGGNSDNLLDRIFGYAAEARVTGGTKEVYVTTKEQLKSALAAGGNYVKIDPSLAGSFITLNTGDDLSFGENTTLDGSEAPGFKIVLSPDSDSSSDKIHGILLNRGNGIVHSIHLQGPYQAGTPRGNSASGIFSRTGVGYWIDHVTISGMDDDSIAIGDAERSNTSRMVTVSYAHIYDSIKAIMFVHNGANPQGNPTGYTGAYNHIEGYIADRNPLVDGTQDVHWYNNYVNGTNRSADVGKYYSGGNTTIALFENNFYENQITNSRAFHNPTSSGSWSGIAWLYLNGGNETNGQSVTGPNIVNANSGQGPGAPQIPYTYELLPASEVPRYVRANAGAFTGP